MNKCADFTIKKKKKSGPAKMGDEDTAVNHMCPGCKHVGWCVRWGRVLWRSGNRMVKWKGVAYKEFFTGVLHMSGA